jgi:hypothetical protein
VEASTSTIPRRPSFDIASGESYGLTVGWITSPSTQIDFLWSHQGTDLELDGSIPGHGDSLSGFDIDNFQLEGSWMSGTPGRQDSADSPRSDSARPSSAHSLRFSG